MSDDIRLSTFPNNRFEALTMLYLQNQDLSGLTPEEILDKYDEACDKIKLHNKETYSDRRLVGWTKL